MPRFVPYQAKDGLRYRFVADNNEIFHASNKAFGDSNALKAHLQRSIGRMFSSGAPDFSKDKKEEFRWSTGYESAHESFTRLESAKDNYILVRDFMRGLDLDQLSLDPE